MLGRRSQVGPLWRQVFCPDRSLYYGLYRSIGSISFFLPYLTPCFSILFSKRPERTLRGYDFRLLALSLAGLFSFLFGISRHGTGADLPLALLTESNRPAIARAARHSLNIVGPFAAFALQPAK